MMNRFVEFTNRISTTFVIFFALVLTFQVSRLDGNTEVYLAWAKQYFNPEWMPYSFSLNEWPGARLLYQLLAGFFLQFVSFETVCIVGSLLFFFLLAIPLAKILKKFEISNLETLFLLQFFYFSSQSFLAHEWIFGQIESKVIAYFFSLYAFYYYLENKNKLSIILLVISTYFHVLVGAWVFVTLISCLFVRDSFKLSNIFKLGVLYFVFVLPLVIYLGSSIFSKESVTGLPSADYLYTYYRHAHHLAPFTPSGYLRADFSNALIICLMFFVTNICIYFLSNKDSLKKAALFSFIAIGIIFDGIIIAKFDKEGFILKFFLFRISALGKLFSIFVCFAFFKELAERFFKEEKLKKYLFFINLVFLIILVPSLLISVNKTFEASYLTNQERELRELSSYAKQNTPKDSVFLFLNVDKKSAENPEVSFERLSERNRFVVKKFTPVGASILKWYQRILEKERLEENLDDLFILKNSYQINYLVSSVELEKTWLEKIYEIGRYRLYLIN